MHHRLMRCLVCGLVYADPAPAPDELAAAYSEAAYDSQNEARLASRTYASLVDRFVDRLPDRTGVLDIGTGDGSFLMELLGRGFTEIEGIEPSSQPIAAADPAVRSSITQGVFTPGTREPSSLSLITCFQTIEHLPDPLAVCREALHLLKPGGALLLVAHNLRALSARVLRERSPIFDVEHLQLFTPQTAHLLLRRSGFADVRVRPIINRYPLSYWGRLSPLPPGMKQAAVAAVSRGPLPRLTVPLPAGNMSMLGFRARSAPAPR